VGGGWPTSQAGKVYRALLSVGSEETGGAPLLALFEKWVPARLRSDESYASVYTYSPLRAASGACMRKATKNRKLRQMSGRALTTRQKRELAALAALPDDQIDTSDIP
jgi:hypothetical protein